LSKRINVVVWNEYLHEVEMEEVRQIYPDGIHNTIAAHLRKNSDISSVKTATLVQPEHGLTEALLAETDVLLWWGHGAHEKVEDEIVQRVYDRVQAGMGLVVLHSGHASKIFSKLMGTNTDELKWREDGTCSTVFTVMHNHPIAKGLPDSFVVPQEETYGERFEIPTPDDIIFISSFGGGPEVFRSGVTFTRGLGRIFYFQPGHETYPVYHQAEVLRVIENGVLWTAPDEMTKPIQGHRPLD